MLYLTTELILPSSPDVIVEANETVWNGRFPLHVIKFRQRRFDGASSGLRTWEMLRRGKAAAVLPYDPVADRVVWFAARRVYLREKWLR